MEMRPHPGNQTSERSGGSRLLQDRFGAHFPRLFAYARSSVGDTGTARDIVVEAFCRAHAASPRAGEPDFRLALFACARGLCRPLAEARKQADGLSNREREVLSLLFDARLSRDETGRLLELGEKEVDVALIAGLRKLRTAHGPASRSLSPL